MSELGFPLKDLTRRKRQTTLTVLSLVISTATTVFLVLFASNLGFEISVISKAGKLTGGFTNIFSQFISIVSFLNLITGPVIASFLVHLSMTGRMKDVGIMKASGCLTNLVFSYFITELSMLIFFSTAIGAILGVVAFYVGTFLLSMSGVYVQQTLDIGSILVTSTIIITMAHIFGAMPIRKAARAKPTQAMSAMQSLGITNSARKISSKLGFTLKVALRSVIRRKSTTIQATICLTTVLTLTTFALVGGMVANQTTISYSERAIGKNIAVIGHPNITKNYLNFLNKFFEKTETQAINYTAPDVIIPESIITKLNNLNGIQKIDPRIMLEQSVREVPGIIPDPIDPTQAIIIGDSRSDEALIFGVDPKNVVNEWLVFGRKLEAINEKSVLIGDSLAVNIFVDARNQSIKIFEKSLPYDIVGICVDPINTGKVVYMPLETVYETTDQKGYNLLFVQIDYTINPEIITQINSIVSTGQLSVIELDPILEKHVAFLDNIWSLIIFLPLFSLATATISLQSYVMLSVSEQQREFGIMRALGAKTTTILKTVMTQTSLIIITSGTIGISIGILFSLGFFIPNPVISQNTVIYLSIELPAILASLCALSVYPALAVGKKPIADAI